MLESFPFATELYAPLESAEIIGEIVGCNAFTTEVYT